MLYIFAGPHMGTARPTPRYTSAGGWVPYGQQSPRSTHVAARGNTQTRMTRYFDFMPAAEFQALEQGYTNHTVRTRVTGSGHYALGDFLELWEEGTSRHMVARVMGARVIDGPLHLETVRLILQIVKGP